MRPHLAITALVAVTSVTVSPLARAGDKQASPADVASIVPTLKPGDTLHLAGGTYGPLTIDSLNGTAAQWITIRGPDSGAPARFVADPGPCCNTIEIVGSSYVAIEKITIDGNHVDGAFGVSAKSGVSHDIRIEDCDIVNHDGGQQQDGISTKVPVWGWILRGNRIKNAGTGVYLGNSTGDDPFVGGLIENNLIEDPIGYCMEIKFQNPRPNVPGMPTGPTTTIIRNNVFIKGDGPSPDGDRPNLLVGGFPASGAGSMDRYEIYGNVFVHNPRERLLQASGRVTIHDNVFVDSAVGAVLLQDHDLPLRQAYVYDNTIYDAASGIHFGSAAPDGDAVFGNLVFSDDAISGTIADQRDNLTAPFAMAASFVNAPSAMLGAMDFYPLAGKCEGSAIDMTKAKGDTDWSIDFNGTSRGAFTFRGAYAGAGKNPGWPLADANKPPDGSSMTSSSSSGSTSSGASSSGATSSGVTSSGGASSSGAGGASDHPPVGATSPGCSCEATGEGGELSGSSSALGLAVLALLRRRRRASSSAQSTR